MERTRRLLTWRHVCRSSPQASVRGTQGVDKAMGQLEGARRELTTCLWVKGGKATVLCVEGRAYALTLEDARRMHLVRETLGEPVPRFEAFTGVKCALSGQQAGPQRCGERQKFGSMRPRKPRTSVPKHRCPQRHWWTYQAMHGLKMLRLGQEVLVLSP